MQGRLTRLLDVSPAVIYSFKAKDDFAPIFVSENITSLFGFGPREYLDNPNFWRERSMERTPTRGRAVFYRLRRHLGAHPDPDADGAGATGTDLCPQRLDTRTLLASRQTLDDLGNHRHLAAACHSLCHGGEALRGRRRQWPRLML
jgi:hypothetical protein